MSTRQKIMAVAALGLFAGATYLGWGSGPFTTNEWVIIVWMMGCNCNRGA